MRCCVQFENNAHNEHQMSTQHTTDSPVLGSPYYVKLVFLKSLTISEVNRLVSDDISKEDGKNWDCYLCGAKYYCTKSIANETAVAFDFCQKSHKQTNNFESVTMDNNSNKKEIVSDLRSIPHKDGFISIEGENDCNGFYVGAQSESQQKQPQHLFLRFSRLFSPKLYDSIPFFYYIDAIFI